MERQAALAEIVDAWAVYNNINAEHTYHLAEGGETDMTSTEVDEAWDKLDRLIRRAANADVERPQKASNVNAIHAGILASVGPSNARPHYSAAVDAHIYGPGPGEGCQTRGDWELLAQAAMDQGAAAERGPDRN